MRVCGMQVWQNLYDAFQVCIVLLIGPSMSDILVALVHSVLDERKMEDALSPKTTLNNFKKT